MGQICQATLPVRQANTHTLALVAPAARGNIRVAVHTMLERGCASRITLAWCHSAVIPVGLTLCSHGDPRQPLVGRAKVLRVFGATVLNAMRTSLKHAREFLSTVQVSRPAQRSSAAMTIKRKDDQAVQAK